MRRRAGQQAAFTLFELILVIGLIVILMSLVMPTVLRDLDEARLPESCRQFRALLQLTRANAMLDGKRYRVRFPRDDEMDGQGGHRQPIVEIERDPLLEPEIFTPVKAAWARDPVFDSRVRCIHVRLGRPTVESMMGEEDKQLQRQTEAQLEKEQDQSFERGFPPLIMEPDGTSEWATFIITDASDEIAFEDLDPEATEYQVIDVILDGLMGLSWLQRQLYPDELDMMRDNGWPPILRKDFLNPVALTEDNVLEIRESYVKR